jgi:tetratricopeptide (TPR) repeat protein
MSEPTAGSHGPADAWLRDEFPDLYYMLRAVDGDPEAHGWLELKSRGLALFTRALGGDRKALQALESGAAVDLDDLYGTIDNCDVSPWLGGKHPELALLCAAIKGDDDALRRLKRKKASLAKVALAVRAPYQEYRRREPDAVASGPSAGSPDPEQPLPDGAAADMGCLIGELHLSKGDYAKAVEAFTRSIANNPSADVYEGRARAYRALAAEDESRARALRAKA